MDYRYTNFINFQLNKKEIVLLHKNYIITLLQISRINTNAGSCFFAFNSNLTVKIGLGLGTSKGL